MAMAFMMSCSCDSQTSNQTPEPEPAPQPQPEVEAAKSYTTTADKSSLFAEKTIAFGKTASMSPYAVRFTGIDGSLLLQHPENASGQARGIPQTDV